VSRRHLDSVKRCDVVAAIADAATNDVDKADAIPSKGALLLAVTIEMLVAVAVALNIATPIAPTVLVLRTVPMP